ncbi:hypothetical protein Tco_1085937, partial [Tanacetum coccineum]
MPPERKAGVVAKIRTQFDLRPHMEFDRWPQIYAGIQQHLQKIYNGKKAALKERHWVPDEDGTYDVERIRRERPLHISEVDWDAQIAFWNDPKNLARAAQNKQNRAKNKVVKSEEKYILYFHERRVISPITTENISYNSLKFEEEISVVVAASDQDISTCEDIPEIKLKWENLTSSPDRDFQQPRRDAMSTEIDVCIAESVASNNMKQAKGCFKAYDDNNSMKNGNSNSNGRRDTVSKERVGAGKKDTGKLTKKP